jgi:threonine synthase
MHPFLTQEADQLSDLAGTLSGVFRLYNDRKTEMSDSLLAFLDDAAGVYKARGHQQKETQVLSLKAELVTALRAVNPMTLERVTQRRHEMQNGIAFKVLQSVELRVRNDLEEVGGSLRQAEELLSQIIVAAIQKGLISEATIAETTTQTAIEALWKSIADDADIAIAQKRLLLMVSIYDVYLLLDKLLAGLRAS